jgi:hypothetical protein
VIPSRSGSDNSSNQWLGVTTRFLSARRSSPRPVLFDAREYQIRPAKVKLAD